MKKLLITALIATMSGFFAIAEETNTQMQIPQPGMMGGGMKMQRQKTGCGMMMQDDNGMMCGMGGGGMGMMGDGIGIMADPEIQKIIAQEVLEHRKKMMQQRMEFQKALQKKVLSHPKTIEKMLETLLQNPEALKGVLDKNPQLKERLKKAL